MAGRVGCRPRTAELPRVAKQDWVVELTPQWLIAGSMGGGGGGGGGGLLDLRG